MPLTVKGKKDKTDIIGIDWYDGKRGYRDPNSPSLAIALANGKVQLTRSVRDHNPVLIDTGLKLNQCKWNTTGTALALSGTQKLRRQRKGKDGQPTGKSETATITVVQFYNPFGVHLRSMNVRFQFQISNVVFFFM